MALGKYSRVDGRKASPNYCSTVTIIVFVAVCLVGVWMMTSSSVVPVQNSEVSSQESKTDLKTQVNESNESDAGSNENNNASDESNTSDGGKAKQFEDTPGDLPDDATKGDIATSEEKNKETGKTAEENKKEKSEEENKDEPKSEDESKGEKDNEEEKKENGDDKNSEEEEKTESKSGGEGENGEGSDENKSDTGDAETKEGDKEDSNIEEKEDKKDEKKESSNEVFPSGAQSELLNETTTENGAFPTQATESKNEKEAQKSSDSDTEKGYSWKLCNVTAGPDYIPCLDNLDAIRHLRSTKHYEHRERHCPDDPPTCLVPLPEGYQRSIEWPTSREKIWYHNVPHTKLAEVKGHQNWVKVSGEYLTFPGGGTQFKHGALHYIDFIQQSLPDIAWGKRTRVILDVGCGVASFGGYLFERNVLAMSFAPKDEHEAQVQFALERGIPAISAVMGTKRLPYPGRVFDVVHCARCRVPWHIEGGKLLLELNRLLRPGGFFVWSATPVYQKLQEDVEIWEAMKKLTKSMCWELVQVNKDRVNGVGVAFFRKPTTNECYEQRSKDDPPLCQESDDPNAAWNVPLQACMHKVPTSESERGSQWPESWPARLEKSPYWLLSSETGVYGKPAPEDFAADYKHWTRVVTKSYLNGMGINWSTVRNVMDMNAVYGGFAAALKDLKVWVMNIVAIDSPDTLPIIYERGLFGMYHDWCESFSTYPRSYDLLHADHLFSKIKRKCNLMGLVVEVDRILRPEGKLIVRDHTETITELENILKSMHYDIRMTYSNGDEGLLCVQKTMWRPKELQTLSYAIA
nr:probable methyltransferase PMT26 [Ipomoea trifida]